ncbi:uncharacterized protein LOC112158803 isoform X2 [Oryzias melastigma]|uniref:uncharacterized protein LOC112158803 isoform X2 n=1 Tax=Oryzias melastigma TaxID=30732 RepID=UPI000CF7C9D7|nr:uncharacterized protein LOC112158803 isoform X2 [Oryzias melastigma]
MRMTSISRAAGPAVNQSNFKPWARLRSPATRGELDTRLLSANSWKAEDNKEPVAICLQRGALDRITGSWSDLHHSPTSHNAEQQDVTFPAAYFTAPGSSRLMGQRLHPSEGEVEDPGCRLAQHEALNLSRLEYQQRAEALEQQHQMKMLEWENRMKVLAWEQELLRDKRRAARQKEKAFRMKKAYYKARLRRLGEDAPPSSSSSGDEEEKASDLTG